MNICTLSLSQAQHSREDSITLQKITMAGQSVYLCELDGRDVVFIENPVTGETLFVSPRIKGKDNNHDWARTCLAAGVWPDSAGYAPPVDRFPTFSNL